MDESPKAGRDVPDLTGLVLTAGGARGAYQAGVLKRLGELTAFRGRAVPFPVISGASAGAINGTAIAAHSADFAAGCTHLAALWSQLQVTDVMRTDLWSLGANGLRLAADLSLGGLIGAGRVQALFDAAPLRAFLQRNLPLDGIASGLRRRQLYAVAVTATGYHSGKAFTFVQGRRGHPTWNKSRRVAMPAVLGIDHVLASSAIPLVFPPVPLTVNGAGTFFGDGALRLVTPLSPAIRLGADRVFAVGVRCQDSANQLQRSEVGRDGPSTLRRPPLAQICGVFMNAIFLDHLDADVDHLRRMNELVSAYDGNEPARRRAPTPHEPMRVVEPLVVSPSQDIAIIARTFAHRMPRAIRYLLEGLGTPEASSADLMSYLLFDRAFLRELIDLGYRDAHTRIDEIESFLRRPRRHAPAPTVSMPALRAVG